MHNLIYSSLFFLFVKYVKYIYLFVCLFVCICYGGPNLQKLNNNNNNNNNEGIKEYMTW